MNYYDEILEKIADLIDQKDFDEAKRLLLNELEMPYIPKDIETKLHELLEEVKVSDNKREYITDEQLEEMLNGDAQHQLIAVNELDHRNLRDYIDLCEKYLKGNGYVNAKSLLIDSLTRQAIDYDFLYADGERNIIFNPKNLIPADETEFFKKTLYLLQEDLMKEPSKLQMAQQLLYKEVLLALPEMIDEKMSENYAEKIEKFIEDAFR